MYATKIKNATWTFFFCFLVLLLGIFLFSLIFCCCVVLCLADSYCWYFIQRNVTITGNFVGNWSWEVDLWVHCLHFVSNDSKTSITNISLRIKPHQHLTQYHEQRQKNPNCVNKTKWPNQLNIWISFSSFCSQTSDYLHIFSISIIKNSSSRLII